MSINNLDEDPNTTRPQEYRTVLDRKRFRALSRQVPLSNFIIVVGTWALAFTNFQRAPVALTLYCPIFLTFLCAMHVTWWTKLRAGIAVQIVARLASGGQFSCLVTCLSSAWAISLFVVADAYSQAHILVFLAVTIVGSISCLTHSPSAAVAIGAIVNAALAAVVIPSGNSVLVTIALTIFLVSGALLLILFGNFRDFISLVEGQVRTETLSRENHRLANIDSLTHLPNRRRFFSRLHELCDAASSGGSRVALGMLDLDGFKAVNDLYGHAIGDSLLTEVAHRLRRSCSDEAFLARLGGDEYAIVISDAQEANLIALGEQIFEEIRAPYLLEGISVIVSASIGFAIYPEHASRPDLLFEHADYALYEAKKSKTGRPVVFCEEYSFAIQKNARIEQALRDTDLRAELSVVFQPIIELATGRAVAFEALCRWESRVLGDVSPAHFIPIAEKAGLVGELTNVLLEKALCAARQWPQPLRLSFNLSSKYICSAEGVLRIACIILKSGFDPWRIDFEITETAVLHDFPQAIRAIEALKALGCGVSLDDFGTGYSTLSQLQTLPITKLKIDRSFVTDLQERTTGYKIVKAMLSLASDMEIECIVEGVETEEELRTLRKLGCKLVQGFHMSKPLDSEAAQRCAGAILVEPEKLLA